jgi:peroxiredoxin
VADGTAIGSTTGPASGPVVLIDEDGHAHELAAEQAEREGSRLLLDPSSLLEHTGWAVEPEGLCRGDTCLPRTLWPDLLTPDDRVDAAQLALAADQPVVVDLEAGVVALGPAGARRRASLETLTLPPLDVADLDGRPVDLAGLPGKKLLMSFASWCGCRHELAAWEEIHEELRDHDFTIVAVAVDEDPDDPRPWVEEAGVTFPVILDRDRVVCDALNIRNVPTVTWIDADNRVVRPNDVAFPTDQFRDFHEVDSSEHQAALRRWVLDDELPLDEDDVRSHQLLPTDDEQLARLHFRVGVELHRRGRPHDADRHFTTAGELGPDDFTIRRAALALQGIDPFLSDEFIALWEEWSGRGKPYYTFSH